MEKSSGVQRGVNCVWERAASAAGAPCVYSPYYVGEYTARTVNTPGTLGPTCGCKTFHHKSFSFDRRKITAAQKVASSRPPGIRTKAIQSSVFMGQGAKFGFSYLKVFPARGTAVGGLRFPADIRQSKPEPRWKPKLWLNYFIPTEIADPVKLTFDHNSKCLLFCAACCFQCCRDFPQTVEVFVIPKCQIAQVSGVAGAKVFQKLPCQIEGREKLRQCSKSMWVVPPVISSVNGGNS